jgi:predicted membrane-bound spermidine synthase
MIIPLLYGIFLLSGAAGLIYESIWTRYLGLFVGHSAYAQVIVLVIFLGGMSLGSYLVGRRTMQIQRPLLWYAGVELLVGALGLIFHHVFVGTTNLAYDAVFPALGLGALQTMAKWSIAALLILPQSVLLGMTFPLMSAGVVRRMTAQPGRALSMLYFTNSLGAAAGVLIAGFWLVDRFGLPGTLTAAALVNVVVALGAGLTGIVNRDSRIEATVESCPVPAPGAATWKPDRLWRMLIATSFVTAVASFIYEIGWTRMLALVLGSATHAFELMLSAFILGLALGAWWIGRRADAAASSLRTLGRVQVAMGALAIATLPIYLASFEWMSRFISAFAETNEGYLGFTIGRYGICLAVMLPATICAGMTLPLITRALIQGSARERAIGQVYSVNTLGSIIGAALAGLVLMPLLGLKWLLVIGALLDVSVGIALLVENARPAVFTTRRVLLTGGLVAALGAIIVQSRFDEETLSSGVYRNGLLRLHGSWPVLFHKDGRTATVTVRRVPSSGMLTLITNGKPDASVGPAQMAERPEPGPLSLDLPTQLFVPLLPLAHVPLASEVAVIGHGSGISTHAILGSPHVRHVTTIEIEPVMIEASRMFMPANRRVFEDPRSEFAIDDARAFFASSQKTFDIIVAEPSNPWVSGVSGLFTTEFYSRAKSRLTPNGVFAQWMHTYEISDDLVLSILSAIDRNFEDWEVFATSGRDILIVASPRKLPAPDWSVMQYPGVAEDLRVTWPVTPRTLEAMRIADRSSLAPLLRQVRRPNSDFFPTVDLNAERARFMEASAKGLFDITTGLNLPAMVRGAREGLGDPYAIIPEIARLKSMSINSAMRAGDPRGGEDARAAAGYAMSFDGELTNGRAPADWRGWTHNFSAVAGLRHGGTAGVIDSAFFRRVGAYVNRHGAPMPVKAAVKFHEAILAWDYRGAAAAANPLIAGAVRGDMWIDPDFLRDGAVMAMLATGDRPGARDAFRALEPYSARPPNDLRNALLLSYIVASAPAR